MDAAVAAVVEMIGERPDRSIAAADVAARIGIPVGSLYEYFEDVPAIVDTAVLRMLDRHDEVLRDAGLRHGATIPEFIDVLFDAYLRLYTEQPAFVVVRNSSFWNEQHRLWLVERVEVFLADLTSTLWRENALGGGAGLDRRFGLIFSAADAMLQRVLREGPKPDPVLVADARAVVKFMFERVADSPS
ncbi:MAG: TetR/AcrR family transcriptional regulator [Ilumatobacteraceae bacterium]